MPQITLSRAQALSIRHDCVTKNQQFFVAKDQGAYVGTAHNVVYFRGCDPVKDKDWYDECRIKFGGDDFGEYLPLEWLDTVVKETSVKSVTIALTGRQIKCMYKG